MLRDKIATLYGYGATPERVFLTENGRCAQYLALQSLGLEKGSKVVVQPFTCNSAVIPVLWNNYDLVYVDIELDTLNMDLKKFEQVVSSDKNIKAVIVQHTFGRAANMAEINRIAGKYELFVIEDCAHALGVSHKGKMLGTFGDASIISFGLEKNLPTKVGGALIVNYDKMVDNARANYWEYKPTSLWRSFLWFMNPPIRVLSRRMGEKGRDLLNFLISVGLFEVGSTDEELHGKIPKYYPARLSKLLARIAYGHFGSLDNLLEKRVKDSRYYFDKLGASKHNVGLPSGSENTPYVKFPYYCSTKKERDELQEYLIRKGYYITDWYQNPIYPKDTDLQSMQYKLGQAPVAEKACDIVLNLPTGHAFIEGIEKDIEEYYASRKNS